MFNWNWKVENQEYLDKTIARCKRENILLPTFEELKNPHSIPENDNQGPVRSPRWFAERSGYFSSTVL